MGVLDEGKTRHDIGSPNGSDNIEFDNHRDVNINHG